MQETINATGRHDNQSFVVCSFAGQSVAHRSAILMAQSRGGSTERPRPLIKFRGGSGAISEAYVERLTLAAADAKDHVAGIKFSGIDGVTARQCVFENLTIGAWFHNEDAGAFTEYCQVHDSNFAATVLTALKYQRSPVCDSSSYPCVGPDTCDRACNATGSFHGSGMKGCVANWEGKVRQRRFFEGAVANDLSAVADRRRSFTSRRQESSTMRHGTVRCGTVLKTSR